jgi:hypothetical protein
LPPRRVAYSSQRARWLLGGQVAQLIRWSAARALGLK